MLGPLGIQVKISRVVKVMTVCIGRTTMDFDDDCDHALTRHGLMKSKKNGYCYILLLQKCMECRFEYRVY